MEDFENKIISTDDIYFFMSENDFYFVFIDSESHATMKFRATHIKYFLKDLNNKKLPIYTQQYNKIIKKWEEKEAELYYQEEDKEESYRKRIKDTISKDNEGIQPFSDLFQVEALKDSLDEIKIEQPVLEKRKRVIEVVGQKQPSIKKPLKDTDFISIEQLKTIEKVCKGDLSKQKKQSNEFK